MRDGRGMDHAGGGAPLLGRYAPKSPAMRGLYLLVGGSFIRLRMESMPVNGRQTTNATNMHGQQADDIGTGSPYKSETQPRFSAAAFSFRDGLLRTWSIRCFIINIAGPLNDNRR